MPMAPRSLLNAAAPCLLLPNPISQSSKCNRLRVDCSSSASTSSTWSNSAAGSRLTSCSATRTACPPLPAFDLQVVEDDDDLEELTFLDDTDKACGSKWLTPQYLSLRLRCSSLMMRESSDALSRHFKGRLPPPKKPVTGIRIKPAQSRHQQLHLMRNHFEGPLELIKGVVMADIQEGYFEDLTTFDSPAASNN